VSSKRNTTYSIDKKILKQFNDAKGCYSKSALVESWIINFIKKEKSLSHPLKQTPNKKTSFFKKRGFDNV